jgi:uncharacterized protein YggE
MPNFAPRAAGYRRRVAIGVLAGLIGLSTACSSKPTVNLTTPQNISSGGVDRGVTVTGSGDVSGTPDTLTASFGVLTVRPSVSEAVAGNAAVAKALTDTLRARGVPAADIQTQNYSVFPSFITVHGRTVPNGYTVGESMVVKLHALARAGSTIDAVIAAGGTSVSVQGVTFSLEDNKALLARARAKAWADATDQARQLGTLSGHHLGPAEGIDARVTPSSYDATREFAQAASTGTATPIAPGQVSTAVDITVRFALA